jgi:fucose permease
LIAFTLGLHDAAVGALIPSMETHYGIGYKVVSFIFLAVAAGFILTATIANAIYSHVGRARTVLAGTSILSIGWLIIAMAPPFPVVVLGFFLIGVGSTLVDHHSTSWSRTAAN